MAQESPIYDLVLLLDAAAPGDRREEVLSEVEGILSGGGTIVGKHDWGPRQLAYEIAHRTEADYHLFQFNGPPETIERLERMLKVTDGVLRHRVIKLRPGTPPPPAMARTERPAAAQAPSAEAEAAPTAAAAAAAPAEAEAAPAEPAAVPAEAAAAPAETPAVPAEAAAAPAETPAEAEAPVETPAEG